MKNLLLAFFFLLVCNHMYAGEYAKVIVPVAVDMLQDSIVSQETYSILRGTPVDSLYEYKTKCNDQTISNSYKNSNWWFITAFTEKVNSKKCSLETYCPSDTLLIPYISYYHVKFMLSFPSNTLTLINKEIHDIFAGQPITCTTKAYISKTRFRNYLHLNIQTDGASLDFIFIIANSTLYQCVINKMS